MSSTHIVQWRGHLSRKSLWQTGAPRRLATVMVKALFERVALFDIDGHGIQYEAVGELQVR